MADEPFSDFHSEDGQQIPEEDVVEPDRLDTPPIVESPQQPVVDLADITQKLDAIIESQNTLDDKFEQKIRYDEQKEAIISKLHESVEQYRRGIHLAFLRPLVEDLVMLHDRISGICNHIENQLSEFSEASDHADSTPQHLKNMQSFLTSIEEMLRSNGFSVYRTTGEVLDTRRSRVIEVIPTNNHELDKRVEESLRIGVEYVRPDDRVQIIRYEDIAVYKLAAPQGDES